MSFSVTHYGTPEQATANHDINEILRIVAHAKISVYIVHSMKTSMVFGVFPIISLYSAAHINIMIPSNYKAIFPECCLQ